MFLSRLDPTTAAARALGGHLRKRAWMVAALTLLSGASGALWSARQPKLYQAVTTLEYDPSLGRAEGGDSSAHRELTYLEQRELFATQDYILQSRALAERVVRALHLDTAQGLPAQRAAAFERAVRRVQASVDVARIPGTRVVSIRVTAEHPERAARLANALADAYLAKSLEDRAGASSRALTWLRGQQAELKQETETATRALHKFRQEHQALAVSLDERRSLLSAELQTLGNNRTELRIRHVHAQARLTVLKEALAGAPDPLTVQAGPIATDAAVSALRERYRATETELAVLSATLGPESQQVRSARAGLEATRGQLVKQLDAILRGAQADLKEVERAETGLQQALQGANAQSLALSHEELEFSSLEREHLSRSERYDLVLERTAQADLARALRASAARVIDRAVRDERHVAPRVERVAAGTGLLGLALGVLAAIGRGRTAKDGSDRPG